MEEKFMREALIEAEKGFFSNEVPVGAVLVYQGEIIARAHNLVEALSDPTAHAELLVLRKGAQILKNWRLLDAVLYCTLEPCPMCAGAMIHSRIKELFWGAKDKRCGANGSWVDLFEKKHPIHQVVVSGGILEKESAYLMETFFKQKRLKDGRNL